MDACEKLSRSWSRSSGRPYSTDRRLLAWYQLGYLRLFQARYDRRAECAERARGKAEENGLSMLLVQATAFRAMVEYRGWRMARAGATRAGAEAMTAANHALSIGYMICSSAARARRIAAFRGRESADQAYRMVAGTGSAHQRMVWAYPAADVLLAAHRLDKRVLCFEKAARF